MGLVWSCEERGLNEVLEQLLDIQNLCCCNGGFFWEKCVCSVH